MKPLHFFLLLKSTEYVEQNKKKNTELSQILRVIYSHLYICRG